MKDLPNETESSSQRSASPDSHAKPSPRGQSKFMAPAAALFAILSGVLLISNLRLIRQVDNLRSSSDADQQQIERSRAILKLMGSPETVSISLSSSTTRATRGRLLYNAQQGALVYVGVMPRLARDKVYELWLFPQTGNPLSIAVFASNETGEVSVILPPIRSGVVAKAFAVTVEPAGGEPQPTGANVQAGTVNQESKKL